ncbi:hypothetical protein D3C73_1010080 [compost metagenome]
MAQRGHFLHAVARRQTRQHRGFGMGDVEHGFQLVDVGLGECAFAAQAHQQQAAPKQAKCIGGRADVHPVKFTPASGRGQRSRLAVAESSGAIDVVKALTFGVDVAQPAAAHDPAASLFHIVPSQGRHLVDHGFLVDQQHRFVDFRKRAFH